MNRLLKTTLLFVILITLGSFVLSCDNAIVTSPSKTDDPTPETSKTVDPDNTGSVIKPKPTTSKNTETSAPETSKTDTGTDIPSLPTSTNTSLPNQTFTPIPDNTDINDEPLTARVSSISAKKGEYATFILTLNKPIDVKAMAVELLYDKNVMSPTSGVWNDTLKNNSVISSYKIDDDKAVILLNNELTAEGNIFTVIFNIPEDAVSGVYSVDINLQITNDSSVSPIAISCLPGTLTIN